MTVSTLASTTLEEACCRPWPWIKQRTRWIKGYMQTALVHTRHPVRFVRMAGLHGTLTLVFLVAGTPLAFLAAPVLWIACLAPLVVGHSPQLGVHRARRRDPRRLQPRDRQRLMIGASALAALLRRRYDLALWALLLPALLGAALDRRLARARPAGHEPVQVGEDAARADEARDAAAGWPAPPLPAHHTAGPNDQQVAA